ncbi:hypothetical protein J7L06_00560 [Candidatus Bathyarchaeota archaeon]|nr:hypothetical protein [Candidatus Bathyarchaeota archaeon]
MILHLIEDMKSWKHDVWPSEIRIKLRGRKKAAVIAFLLKFRRRWKELK